MKMKQCPERRSCSAYDEDLCDGCDFGIILDKYVRKNKKLKEKNKKLQTENEALKAQIETLKHPDF